MTIQDALFICLSFLSLLLVLVYLASQKPDRTRQTQQTSVVLDHTQSNPFQKTLADY